MSVKVKRETHTTQFGGIVVEWLNRRSQAQANLESSEDIMERIKVCSYDAKILLVKMDCREMFTRETINLDVCILDTADQRACARKKNPLTSCINEPSWPTCSQLYMNQTLCLFHFDLPRSQSYSDGDHAMRLIGNLRNVIFDLAHTTFQGYHMQWLTLALSCLTQLAWLRIGSCDHLYIPSWEITKGTYPKMLLLFAGYTHYAFIQYPSVSLSRPFVSLGKEGNVWNPHMLNASVCESILGMICFQCLPCHCR